MFSFNGWGVTMYDGLDTLWLMGLKPEFERAVSEIEKATFYQAPVRPYMLARIPQLITSIVIPSQNTQCSSKP